MAASANISAWAIEIPFFDPNNGHVTYVADMAPSPQPNANLFSDTPPGTYGSYHPNYVAPSAPPPIYTDTNAGTYCREYSKRMRIEGRMQENYGVTCLQPDGSWRVMQ